MCCTHRMQVGDSKEWHYISQHCRNRVRERERERKREEKREGEKERGYYNTST